MHRRHSLKEQVLEKFLKTWSINCLSCTPPMESLFETFLNCQVKLIPWRWLINLVQLFHVTIILWTLKKKFIVCIGISTSPKKHPHTLFFDQYPRLNLQTFQVPHFQSIPSIPWFFVKPPFYKSNFSVSPHNVKFFFLNLSLSFDYN